MQQERSYNTAQARQLQALLEENTGRHLTAGEIHTLLEQQGVSMGYATIYRRLEKLTKAGLVLKYKIDAGSSACYTYIGPQPTQTRPVYHMKCEQCGRIIHLTCKEVEQLERHIAGHHGFIIDPVKTVLYGQCKDCQEK